MALIVTYDVETYLTESRDADSLLTMGRQKPQAACALLERLGCSTWISAAQARTPAGSRILQRPARVSQEASARRSATTLLLPALLVGRSQPCGLSPITTVDEAILSSELTSEDCMRAIQREGRAMVLIRYGDAVAAHLKEV